MRPIIRTVLMGLVITLGVVGVAGESWASFSAGSRLLFYYTQKSLVNPSAAPGSATTIVGITNDSVNTAVNVRVNIFNGSTCANFGPVQFTLAPRRTLRLNIGTLVTAAGFPEGWMDVYAVGASGALIRWDQLSGKGTILDFGGANTAAATYESAALFSDASDRSSAALQGTPIADNNNANTAGMVGGTVEFWGQGGTLGVSQRLIGIPVSPVPGTAPVPGTFAISWYKSDGTADPTGNSADTTCMLASSLAALHPGFAVAYPSDGSLTQGGNLFITSSSPGPTSNKGFVGALFETSTTPALLAVHSIQPTFEPSNQSHE